MILGSGQRADWIEPLANIKEFESYFKAVVSHIEDVDQGSGMTRFCLKNLSLAAMWKRN